MDWNQPVGVNVDMGAEKPSWRLKLFFGHFDARIYLNANAYVDVGAGSIDSDLRVAMVSKEASGKLGEIGRFCDLGACEVMAIGDHANDRPVNVGLGGTPLFSSMIKEQGLPWLRKSEPFSIGDNVVISSGAKVLPGAAIGSGCVVGAGSVVTRDLEPFGIYGGVPARRLNDRTRWAPWWDFHPAYMAELLAAGALDDAAKTEQGHRYWLQRPRIAYARVDQDLKFLGIVSGDVITGIQAEPDKVRAYFNQAFGEGPFVWCADPWSL